MPHVIVKLWPGRSEAQKKCLAEKIAQDVTEVLNYGEESISVALEEVKSSDWGNPSLSARHQSEVGHALQKAGLRDVTIASSH